MDNFIAWLLANGRIGGITSVLAGIALGLIVLLDVTATGGFFIIMPPAAVAFLIMGVVLIIWGGSGKELKIKDDAPPPAELMRTLHAQQRPFFFCIRCRRVAEGGMCDKCGSQADCLEIETEDDIQMALSAMS